MLKKILVFLNVLNDVYGHDHDHLKKGEIKPLVKQGIDMSELAEKLNF